MSYFMDQIRIINEEKIKAMTNGIINTNKAERMAKNTSLTTLEIRKEVLKDQRNQAIKQIQVFNRNLRELEIAIEIQTENKY